MHRNHSFSISTAVPFAVTFVLFVVLASLLALAADLLMILYLAGLFGVFLFKVSQQIHRRTRLSYRCALASILTAGVLVSAAFLIFFAAQIDTTINGATSQIDHGFDELATFCEDYPTAKSIVRSIPFISDRVIAERIPERDSDQASKTMQGDAISNAVSSESAESIASSPMSQLAGPAREVAKGVGKFFTSTFGLFVNAILIFVVGVFLATNPRVYRDGFVRLVPPQHRPRGNEVLNELVDSLWHWLIGRFGTMLVTGIGATFLLFAAGVPMAGSIGFLTGLLTFIPNIGAAVSLLLALMAALPQGQTTVFVVFAGYLALQMVESYLVTPIIQQNQVSIPPATLIAFQAMFGVTLGFLGAAVASPILVAMKVCTDMLYVEDFLEGGANRDQ